MPFAVTPSALSVCCDSNVTSAFCGRPERPPIPVAFILAVMDVDETVAVRLIGEVRVVHSGHVVHPRVVGGARCVEVLAYLSVNRNREIPLDEVAGILWPKSRPPQSWYAALRGVLSRVRDTMELASIPAGSSGRVAATSGCRCPTD